jgi:gliding motility-associated-like protein
MYMRGIVTLILWLFLYGVSFTYAQTSTGSLGDPIINLNFGAGNSGTRGAPLGADITNYTYTTGTPNDGFYTIAQSTAGMFDWWSTTDHTGNPGGYMMVVNASVSKTDYFYKQSVTGLCPGTTYEFAAWVMNMAKNNVIKPNITFIITNASGIIIKSLPTGDIPYSSSAPTWIQYRVYFTTPPDGGDITLTMKNNADGGVGNDIALDDITFSPYGPSITSSFLNSASATITGCEGGNQNFQMQASVSTGYMVPAYQWQVNNSGVWTDIPGENTTNYTANFTPAVAGSYQYRLASAEAVNIASPKCRVVSNPLTLTINTLPSATILGSPTVCEGDAITLSASPGDMYTWTGPNGFTSTLQSINIPNATPANSGRYNVTVTKSECSITAYADVVVNARPIVTVSADVSICQGITTTLQATGGVSYQWLPATGLSDPASANPTANPESTTTYTVTVTNASGCSDKKSVTVTVVKPPVVNAGDDIKMTEGQSVTLNGSATGDNITYFWTPATGLSNSAILNPIATPTQDITYTLHAIAGNSCGFETTDDVFVRVYKKVVVPNTFTPNNDGINDTWNIEALETYPLSITQVFNRYGTLIFQSIGYGKPWDGRQNGKPVPEGTYYYKIDLKNGQIFSGWLAILR